MTHALAKVPHAIKNTYQGYLANQEAKAAAKAEAVARQQTEAVATFVSGLLNGRADYQAVLDVRVAFDYDFWAKPSANTMFDAIEEGLSRAGCGSGEVKKHMAKGGLVLTTMREVIGAEATRIDEVNALRKQKFETSYDLVSKTHLNSLAPTLTLQEERLDRGTEIRNVAQNIFDGTVSEPLLNAYFAHATKEFSAENINFLLAARPYAATMQDQRMSVEERRDMLQNIVNTFTDLGIPGPEGLQDVNISSQTRKSLKSLVDPSTREIKPDIQLTGKELRPAIIEIISVLNDTTIRFKQTEAAHTYIDTGK